jgi:hypothetical protein
MIAIPDEFSVIVDKAEDGIAEDGTAEDGKGYQTQTCNVIFTHTHTTSLPLLKLLAALKNRAIKTYKQFGNRNMQLTV